MSLTLSILQTNTIINTLSSLLTFKSAAQIKVARYIYFFLFLFLSNSCCQKARLNNCFT